MKNAPGNRGREKEVQGVSADCTKCTKEHDSPTECGCGRCTGK